MILSVGTLIFQVYLRIDMSSSTRRQQHERDNEYSSDKQQQQEATIRSIDMTKDNIRRSIEEVRRERQGILRPLLIFRMKQQMHQWRLLTISLNRKKRLSIRCNQLGLLWQKG